MVNIVDVALAIAQLNQRLDARHNVFLAQRALGVFGIQCQTHVHFHPTDGRQIIALTVKEQSVKQRRCRLDRGRLSRAHDPVDIHQRGVAVQVFIHRHRIAHIRTNSDVIDIQHWNVGNTSIQ